MSRRIHGIGDPVSTTGNASIHKSQTVRVGVEEECVDARQAYPIPGWIGWTLIVVGCSGLKPSHLQTQLLVLGAPSQASRADDLTRRRLTT